MKLSQVTGTTQNDFMQSMSTYEKISKTLPSSFDHSNWNEFMRHANSMVLPSSSKPSTKQLVRKPPVSLNTLQKARDLAARQTPQGMSAQLLAARQYQATTQMHAQRIAQQAAATQAPQPAQAQQRRAGSQEGEGPLPEAASPQLPTPSSPPQMRTFVHPPTAVRSNSLPASDPGYALPPLAKFTTTGAIELGPGPSKGVKRKAGDISTLSTTESQFSPSKVANAARNKFGEVQQLFKTTDLCQERPANCLERLKSMKGLASATGPATQSQFSPQTPAPDVSPTQGKNTNITNLTSLEKNDIELLEALKEGKPIKYCFNCGTIQTKGNWRALIVDDAKQNLCNACGVYYKNKKTMRPPNLWKPISAQSKTFQSFPTHSGSISIAKGGQSFTSSEEPKTVKSSPVSKDQSFKIRARAVQSSPAPQIKRASRSFPTSLPYSSQVIRMEDARPITPEKKQEVLHELSLNTPPGPPSPSPASGGNLEDLVALLQTPKKSFTSRVLSSPSPWRSMFTNLPEESPARQKLDRFLEDLGNTNFDLTAFSLSPGTQNLASFMSSPPSLGLFTSSAGGEEQTPEDNKGTEGHSFIDGDSLFTPHKPTTRSETLSAQKTLRSAGARFGENMFGEAL